jgi:CrcB protein
MNTGPGPDLRWDVLAVIALGGVLGSLARWSLTFLAPPTPGRFPWATFTANVSGCLLMGALMVVVLELTEPSRYLRPFLAVGVLGGYTTFSTFMLDVRGLADGGHALLALTYLAGSLAAGLAAVWLGALAARAVAR